MRHSRVPLLVLLGLQLAGGLAGAQVSVVGKLSRLEVLQPGETVLMPVSFFVDPAIVDDREGQYVHTITLSYTFYQIDLPEDELAAAQAADVLTSQPVVGIETN